jgi:hypothetical protein
MLDAIDRALEKAARQARRAAEQTPSPRQIERPAKPVEQMTARELLDAMDRALEKAARLASAP